MKVVGIAYPTLVVRYDLLAQLVIVQHRNPSTGDISYQVPSAEQVRSEEQAALAAYPEKPPGASDRGGTATRSAGSVATERSPPPEAETNGDAAPARVSLIA